MKTLTTVGSAAARNTRRKFVDHQVQGTDALGLIRMLSPYKGEPMSECHPICMF